MITLIIPCYNERINLTNKKKYLPDFLKNNDHLIVDGDFFNDASLKL